MTYACEIPAEEWGDEERCPNCGGRDVMEWGYRMGSRPMRTHLECRDCGAYSTWRVPPADTGWVEPEVDPSGPCYEGS